MVPPTDQTSLWLGTGTDQASRPTSYLEAHQQYGVLGVNHVLATKDNLEHALSRIGAEISLQLTGDWEMFENLLSTQPPGRSQILPEWAVNAGRWHSRLVHQQQNWLKGDQSDDGEGKGRRIRNREKKAAAKARAEAKNKGGKDKGGKGGQGGAAVNKS